MKRRGMSLISFMRNQHAERPFVDGASRNSACRSWGHHGQSHSSPRILVVPKPASVLEPAPGARVSPGALLEKLPTLLDHQQQVNEAGELVAGYLGSDGDPDRLLALLGKMLLREDRDFHTIQTVEAAFRQFELLRGTPAATHVLVAAVRYLGAHAPTVRAQGQIYRIAHRLHRGERLYEER